MTTTDGSIIDVTTETSGDSVDLLKENLERVEALSKRLIDILAQRRPHNPGLDAPNHELFTRAATSYWASIAQDPTKLMAHQVEYWGKTVKNFSQAQKLLSGQALEGVEKSQETDRRFANPMWQTHPYFRCVKQQYLINAQALREAVAATEELDGIDKQRLSYFADQIINMMAPPNFLATNPDALERAIETEGQSLITGLENLVADLEANQGELVVRLADETAFEVGENIATSAGQVVFRNRMMELIQFAPTTKTVHEIPIVLFPPWINKFYVLDLKEKNSFVKWVTDQGYTLFVVSWVNPDSSYADVQLEDYITDGYLKAIEVAKEICAVKQVNAVGYCIAGTTLGLALALMKKRDDKSIKSATFFTTLTDFCNQGEFTPFLQNDFVDAIEAQIGTDGILPSHVMARTFSFLRSNDLIYGPAIRNYMLGETPPAFDLLYWNGDGTNLPGKMAVQYLRHLCQENRFADGGMNLFGETLHLKEVDVPVMSITCESDHIASWSQCYRGFQQMGGRSKQFVVSQSGHIAGIVNPVSRNKYGHYVEGDRNRDAPEWMEGATFNEGSWWPTWEAWLKKRSGKQIPARQMGSKTHPPLIAAPGSYVKVRAVSAIT